MTYRILILLLGLPVLGACQPAAKAPPPVSAATAPDPKAFLTSLYENYDGRPSDTDFTPLNENAPKWFDPDMVALMAEDHRRNEGYVGAIEADPVCGCQDFSILKADINIVSQTPSTAKAAVLLQETSPDVAAADRAPRNFTYSLVLVNGQWRIHDIGSPEIPSLRDWIAKSNREAAASSQ